MKYIPIAIATLAAMVIAGCNTPTLQSTWKTGDIPIDGNPGKWGKSITYTQDDQFGLAVANDDKNLYLCVVSMDNQVNRQIMRAGFTVWFRHKETGGARVGIHFPIGRKNMEPPSMNHNSNEGESPELSAHAQPGEPGRGNDDTLSALEFIGPKDGDTIPLRRDVADGYGIAVKLAPSHDNLVYELKIPLHGNATSPYTLGIVQDTAIKVLFETTEQASLGGGPGGGGPGGGDQTADQFKTQVIVHLAKETSAH